LQSTAVIELSRIHPSEEVTAVKTKVTMTINGVSYSHEVEPRMLLVHFIRELAGLTGTHVGCDTSQCGACTINLNGLAVKSCTLLAVQADGAQITTIEGLAKDGKLHPIQEAFWEKHGLQCGFCTPGMIMSAAQILQRHWRMQQHGERTAQLSGLFCRQQRAQRKLLIEIAHETASGRPMAWLTKSLSLRPCPSAR